MLTGKTFWDDTAYMLEKAMDVSVLRRKVIADNIANVDVPHFKRSEVSFEAQLRRALDSQKAVEENAIPARVNDPLHIPFFKGMDLHDVEPRMHMDYLSTMRNDGNNVDIEHEITESAKNQLRYEALTSVYNGELKTLNVVLRPGN